MNIANVIGMSALMGQLAEECAELAQAALKIQRILDGKNPTPVTMEKAKKSLAEESTDVQICLEEISKGGIPVFNPDVYCEKLNRWQLRLAKESEVHNG